MLTLLLCAQIIGGVIAGSAAVVIAIVVLAIVCYKKAKTKRKELAHDPWHLTTYGLTRLVKEDDLRPCNHLKKGFESSFTNPNPNPNPKPKPNPNLDRFRVVQLPRREGRVDQARAISERGYARAIHHGCHQRAN